MAKAQTVTEIDVKNVERIANILGNGSAAAKALERGAELAAEGVDVGYYQMGQTILVGPRITEEEAEASDESAD